MQITDRFDVVPVAGIKPDEHNARKHSDEQIIELRRSLREFDFVNPRSGAERSRLLLYGERPAVCGRDH